MRLRNCSLPHVELRPPVVEPEFERVPACAERNVVQHLPHILSSVTEQSFPYGRDPRYADCGDTVGKSAEARNSGNAVLRSKVDSAVQARSGIEETVVANAKLIYQQRAEDMGLGHSHVLAPKNLGSELQVIEVPSQRNAGQVHGREPCLVADAIAPENAVLVRESVIESGIALIGGIK